MWSTACGEVQVEAERVGKEGAKDGGRSLLSPVIPSDRTPLVIPVELRFTVAVENLEFISTIS